MAETGRGLHLVESFSENWGWHPLSGAGKGRSGHLLPGFTDRTTA